jgi:hypothetical protein
VHAHSKKSARHRQAPEHQSDSFLATRCG